MGESYGRYALGNDAELMPLITSCNLACGFHAGDPVVMEATIALAKRYGTRIGAHPGYPDRQGFGRRDLRMSGPEVRAMVAYQIGALTGMCRARGVKVSYLKPHGALYHAAAREEATAAAIVAACRAQGIEWVMGAPDSVLQRATEAGGLSFIREGFADRGYGPDGRLLPRGEPGALIQDPAVAARQARQLAREHSVTTPDGTTVAVAVDSLCIHGDNPRAVEIARAVVETLRA